MIPVDADPAYPSFTRAVQRRPARTAYRVLVVLIWLLGAALVALFVQQVRGAAVPAATAIGRIYGLIGAVLFAFLALYGLRRIGYRIRLGTLETWYRAHLVLGSLALVLLACHSGFAFRTPFLAALQIAFWGAFLSGIFGWAYQSCMKAWMVRHEYRPAVRSELESRRDELLAQLTAAAADGASANPQDQAAARADLNRVEVLLTYHRRLRFWTIFHLLFTVAGIQLALWHIWIVAVYPR